MRKSLHIDLCAHFGVPMDAHGLTGPCRPRLTLRHADLQCYRCGADEAIQQEFDGKYGYLYSFELKLQQAIRLPVKVDIGDLHVLYLMEGDAEVELLDMDHKRIFGLAPYRARYLYLPPGDYSLHIPMGFTQLFGFYFDGGIFRDGNEREYRFLDKITQAYRKKSALPAHSIDFMVGPRTRSHIAYLCGNLRKGSFNNEPFVFNAVHRLIELSKEKVSIQESPYARTNYVEAIRERIQQEITDGNGMPALERIADEMQVNPDYINKIHKKLYGITLREYAQSVLLDVAMDMLRHGVPPTQVSYHLNYNSPSSFARFIKKMTGKPPREWGDDAGQS